MSPTRTRTRQRSAGRAPPVAAVPIRRRGWSVSSRTARMWCSVPRWIAMTWVRARSRDGSYLAKFYPSAKHRREDREGILVRLIEYRIDGFRDDYRLVTNILDPLQGLAIELARLYSERWTIETALDELKTHLRGRGV